MIKGERMKRFLSLFLAATLLLSVAVSFSACGGRAPKIEEIYDRVVELIESSYEINDIFYGQGLPYYDRELPVYKEIYSDYTKLGYVEHYNIVSNQAKFRSISGIKYAAEQVYSLALLESSVYPAAFEGVVISDAITGVHSSDARYLESNDDLYILMEEENTHHPARLVYDYATMKIVKPSNNERVLVSITAWEEHTPELKLQTRISLVLQNGLWMLDSLTV